jgi:hypothetical protein
MQRNGSRYHEGLEKCLSNSSSAQTSEIKELWHTMADSYRLLIEHDARAITFYSWLRKNIPSPNE